MKNLLFALVLVSIFSCGQSASSGPALPADLTGFQSIAVPGTEAGMVVKNNEKGELSEKGFTLDGLKTGVWMTYHPGNKIKTLTTYMYGKKNGPHLELSNRGQIELESNYLDDQLNGKVGKYKHGRAIEEMNYLNGQIDGEMKKYHNNGKIQQLITFKNGKQDGKLEYYDDQGNVTLSYIYKNGEKVSGGMVEK